MKNTMQFSDEAFENGVGFGPLLQYAISVALVGFGAVKLCDYLNTPEGMRVGVVIGAVMLYLAFSIASMAKHDWKDAQDRAEVAEAEADEMRAKAELSDRYEQKLRLLFDSVQTLQLEKQSLAEKVRTLEANERTLIDERIELKRMLESEKAGAQKSIADAIADAENKAMQVATPYINKAKEAVETAKQANLRYSLLVEAIGHKSKQASAQGKFSSNSARPDVQAQAKEERDAAALAFEALASQYPFIAELFAKK